ncbi:MAG: hypothetical protein D6721_02755 [Gammaproteobacteria bacterium]|nr:MAG: hypothetical protein D6721_02755 [Gammaproteobacteria bacterium]
MPPEPGPPAPRLLLLFSLPRSGSTWIAKLIDSHPAVAYRHEPDSVLPLDPLPLFPEGTPGREILDRLRAYARALPHCTQVHVVGKRPFFAKAFQPPGWPLLLAAAHLAAGGLRRAGLPVRHLAPAAWGATRAGACLWKSIESLGRLGWVRAALPEATSFHLLRHPCGYVHSVLRGHRQGRFGSHVPPWEDWNLMRQMAETAAGRATGLDLDALRSLSPAERLAWRWRVSNDKALAEGRDLPRHQVLLYEQACRTPREATARLLDQAGLDWHPAVEAFVAASTRRKDADYYGIRKDPWTSAWSWEQGLDARARAGILARVEGSRAWSLYREAGLERRPPTRDA